MGATRRPADAVSRGRVATARIPGGVVRAWLPASTQDHRDQRGPPVSCPRVGSSLPRRFGTASPSALRPIRLVCLRPASPTVQYRCDSKPSAYDSTIRARYSLFPGSTFAETRTPRSSGPDGIAAVFRKRFDVTAPDIARPLFGGGGSIGVLRSHTPPPLKGNNGKLPVIFWQ
jgi:hypothetical protein